MSSKKSCCKQPAYIHSAIVKVTQRCNQSCKYCYLKKEKKDLSLSMFKDFLKEAVPLGLRKIYLHGGEPLLLPVSYYEKIVCFAKKEFPDKKIIFCLMTNGTLLSVENIRGLTKLGISIGLSLDGPENIHNINRGNWDKTMSGIKLLQKEKVRFGIISVISANTIDLINPKKFLEFFVRQKIYDLAFPKCSLITDEVEKNKRLSDKKYSEILIKLFDEWLKLNKRNLKIREFENVLRPLLTGFASQSCVNTSGSNCRTTLTLFPDGKLFNCDNLMYKDEFGSVYKKGNLEKTIIELKRKFMRYFYNNGYKQFIEKECFQCKWFLLCRGGCPSIFPKKNESYCKSFKPLIEHVYKKLRNYGYNLKYFEISQKTVDNKKYLLD